ncbi:hypothetical protein AB0M60_30485, partial [Micromonospora wenchangensis]
GGGDGRAGLPAHGGRPGMAALRDAAPVHVESVRRHLVDRLAPQDLAALERIAGRLAQPPADDDHAGPPPAGTGRP